MTQETITFRISKSALRNQGHLFFDLIWKNGLLTREGAYEWLSKKQDSVHFSRMNRAEIISAIKHCINFLNEANNLTDLPKYKY
jgi:hypothetical protein